MTWRSALFLTWPGILAFIADFAADAIGGIFGIVLGAVGGAFMGYGIIRGFRYGKIAGSLMHFHGGPSDGAVESLAAPQFASIVGPDGLEDESGRYEFTGLDGYWRPYSE